MMISKLSVDDPEVAAMVALHLKAMHENSPPDHVFALDMSGLDNDQVTLYGAYCDGILVGMGALNIVSPHQGEVKSMRTHPGHLRKGVGSAILEVIIEDAKQRGYSVLSLETGLGEAFDAALSLYRQRGFVSGTCFGPYTASGFNQFYHLELGPAVKGPLSEI